jgi:hypothetical protein
MLKLNTQGFAHHFVLVFIVLAVAIGGTAVLVGSHADTTTDEVASACNSASTTHSTTDGLKNCKSLMVGLMSSLATGPKLTRAQLDSQSGFINDDGVITGACYKELGTTTPDATQKTKLATCVSSGETLAITVSGSNTPTKPTPTPTPKPTPAPTPKPAHAYEAHIASNNYCSNIEVEAHDAGAQPTLADNMSVTVQLTGGPYGKNTVFLGPNAPNDPTISGSGNVGTYHHWATPNAVADYYGSTPITETLVLKANGTVVPASEISGAPKSMTMSLKACATAPKPAKTTGSSKGTPAKPVTTKTSEVGSGNKHQYTARITTATCNNIEVEAHDIGSDPSNKMMVEVKLSGGAYAKQAVTLTSKVNPTYNEAAGPYNLSIDGNADGANDHYYWNVPASAPALVKYTDATLAKTGLTTATLTVLDNGKVVSTTGSPHAVTINPCTPTTPESQQVVSYCDNKEYPEISGITAAQKATIDAERAKCVSLNNSLTIDDNVTTVTKSIATGIKLPAATTAADVASCKARYTSSNQTGSNLNAQIQNCEIQLADQQKQAAATVDLQKGIANLQTGVQDKKTVAKQAGNQITDLQTDIKNLKADIKSLQADKKSADKSTQSDSAGLSKMTTSAAANTKGYNTCVRDSENDSTLCQAEYAIGPNVPNELQHCLAKVITYTPSEIHVIEVNGGKAPESAAQQKADCNTQYAGLAADWGKLVNTSADSARNNQSSKVQGDKNSSSNDTKQIAADQNKIAADNKQIDTERGIKEKNEGLIAKYQDKISAAKAKLHIL